MIKNWIDALIHPVDFMKMQGGKTSWGEAFKQVIMAGLIAGVISGFFTMVIMLVAPSMILSKLGPLAALGVNVTIGHAVMAWISAIIMTPIFAVVAWLIWSIMLFITAKILGGTGDFTAHTTNLSWLQASVTFINGLIGWIPFIGQLITLLVQLYALYPLTMILKETHKFTLGKAVLVWLIWVILGIILAVIAFLAMAAFISSIFGQVAYITQ